MRRLTYLVVSLPLILGNLSCTWIRSICSNFHEPSLQFDHVDLLNLDLQGVTIDLHWILHNDNPVGIDIASLAYAFSIEGHPLISGKPRNGLKINPNGNSRLEFPVHVQFAALAQTIEIFLHKDVAHYTASGEIGVNTPIGVVTLPISYSNQFNVPKLPEIRPQPPQLNNISLTSAHLTFPIVVHNKNGFPLPFNGLGGSLTLGSSSVASSTIPQMSSLSPNEQRTLNIGVDVNFLNVGMDVVQAIQSRQVNLGYHGTLDVAGYKMPINVQQNFPIH